MERRHVFGLVFLACVVAALINPRGVWLFGMVLAGFATGYAYGPTLIGTQNEA